MHVFCALRAMRQLLKDSDADMSSPPLLRNVSEYSNFAHPSTQVLPIFSVLTIHTYNI